MLYGDHLYIVKNGGVFSCLDAETGKVHYRERIDSRGPHYASPVGGDGKVYVASARGVVTVLEAGAVLKRTAAKQLGLVRGAHHAVAATLVHRAADVLLDPP